LGYLDELFRYAMVLTRNQTDAEDLGLSAIPKLTGGSQFLSCPSSRSLAIDSDKPTIRPSGLLNPAPLIGCAMTQTNC
jgi:hypothetical protein